MAELILRRVRPMGGPLTDVVVDDGRIAVVGGAGPGGEGAIEFDGGGELLLPGLVDAHAHLDKTLWGLPWRSHTGGPDLAGLIANERAARRHLPPVAERAGALLDACITHGVTTVRSHVDVDPDAGLGSVEGVLAAAEARRDRVTVEVGAFPQSGMLVEPGTAELMDAAVAAGCAAVGGARPRRVRPRPGAPPRRGVRDRRTPWVQGRHPPPRPGRAGSVADRGHHRPNQGAGAGRSGHRLPRLRRRHGARRAVRPDRRRVGRAAHLPGHGRSRPDRGAPAASTP